MEKTKKLFDDYISNKKKEVNLKESIQKITVWLNNFNANKTDEKHADEIDTLVGQIENQESLNTELDNLKLQVIVIENELKSRLNLGNVRSIRIPSEQQNISDSEIHLKEDGELGWGGRG